MENPIIGLSYCINELLSYIYFTGELMNQPEEFRSAMRKWTAGVAIATSTANGIPHGMTVNSFTSVSVEPPMVTVTMAKLTRTLQKTLSSGYFGITILSLDQKWTADRFAGKEDEPLNRFDGLATFTLLSGVPFIEGGLAFFDCKVEHTFEMAHSILLVGKVMAVREGSSTEHLVYTNRRYGGVTLI
jgi:flavin reductase (DIM6/NTAB) family NADH-FMN oxidoreductase RutF